MTLIVHDLGKNFETQLNGFFNDAKIFTQNGNHKHCIGCYNCWHKTPQKCVFHDEFDESGALFMQADKAVIISKCVYGMFSPFVKMVIDRGVSCVIQDFAVLKNETHHKKRKYQNQHQEYFFYGDITEQEKTTAEKLVQRLMLNYRSTCDGVHFYKDENEILNVLKSGAQK